MKREKIVELIVNESETNGDGIYFLDESQVEYLADKLIKLLDLHSVSKRFELDFNGHLKTLVEINDNEPNILAAMNGYGDIVDTNKCTVTKK